MKQIICDVAVVGGGIAGVCAAIAAARHGADTVLLQDRPMLGGNSSSEQRVWAVGATAMGRNRYAAETGIVGELDLENLYRNPEGNPYIWDSILLDFVLAEPKITLLLNTALLEAHGSDTHLNKILAYSMTEDCRLEITAKHFIDCTGDGTLGVMAGADFMRGREAKKDFGESLAPEEADSFTLGNSLLFCSRDAGKPVPYRKPDFAYDIDYIHRLITENEKPLQLHTSGCDLWWLETGGRLDTLTDGQEIRLELQKLVFGIWNYIKNSGHFASENLILDWIGHLPAKRESRRLVGRHILTQNDILEHREFADAVCAGGWPIDTHPPGGIYSKREACEQRDAGIYQIPLGSLQAQKIDNLYFAGRDLSATHLAFASARVMKTCGCMGQAAGTAAALGDTTHLQEELLWDGQWILGVNGHWNQGLEITSASGYAPFENPGVERMHRLDEPLWIMLPAFPEANALQLWMRSDKPCSLSVELYTGSQRKACADLQKLGVQEIALNSDARWVSLEIPKTEDGELYLVLPGTGAEVGISSMQIPGCVGSVGGRTGLRLIEPCFRLEKAVSWFAPEQALTAPVRPEKLPNQWRTPLPGQMTLSLAEGTGRQLQLIFDTDLNRDYNQLKPDYYGNGWDAMPAALARHYRVRMRRGEAWEVLAEETENHRPFVNLSVPDGVTEISLELLSAWGGNYAGIYGIRLRKAAFREEVFSLEGAAVNHPGQGTVYLAIPEQGEEPLPVVLAVHGSHRGALDYRDTPFYAKQRDLALSHGYLFACIDNGSDTWGLEDGYQNILRLYDYLISHHPVQRNMLLWATSAGGTLAYRMAAEHPEKVRLVLGTFPVYDLEAAFRDLPSCRAAWGTTDKEEFLQRIQGKNPAGFSGKLKDIPIYITHGDADDAVPIGDHSLRLQAEASSSVQIETVPGGTHGTANMAFYGQLVEDALS